MQNIASTKKSTGLIEAVNAARRSAMPRTGWRTRTSSAVTAIGMASVAHSTRATANSAAMRQPAAVSPAGGGISSSSAPTAIAASESGEAQALESARQRLVQGAGEYRGAAGAAKPSPAPAPRWGDTRLCPAGAGDYDA